MRWDVMTWALVHEAKCSEDDGRDCTVSIRGQHTPYFLSLLPFFKSLLFTSYIWPSLVSLCSVGNDILIALYLVSLLVGWLLVGWLFFDSLTYIPTDLLRAIFPLSLFLFCKALLSVFLFIAWGDSNSVNIRERASARCSCISEFLTNIQRATGISFSPGFVNISKRPSHIFPNILDHCFTAPVAFHWLQTKGNKTILSRAVPTAIHLTSYQYWHTLPYPQNCPT